MALGVATGVVPVDHHQYLLIEDRSWTPDDPATVTGNGLVEVRFGGVTVLTGMQYGELTVTVQTLGNKPPLDTDGWDEVVDVSVPNSTGQLLCCDVLGVPVEDLPNLATNGPGMYRVRVCARGRDQAARHSYDDPPPDPPLEHHAVLVWAAPAADPVVHKATDQIGATLRGEPDADGVTPPPLDVTEAAHQALRAIAGDLNASRPAVGDELTSMEVEARVTGRRPADVFRYVRFPINWLAHGGRPAESPGEKFRSWIAPAHRLDARGELLKVHPHRSVVFSWQFIQSAVPGSAEAEQATPSPPMTITTTLRRSGDDTVITVSTADVPVDWIDRVRALWNYHLSCVRIFSGGGFPGNAPWWRNP